MVSSPTSSCRLISARPARGARARWIPPSGAWFRTVVLRSSSSSNQSDAAGLISQRRAIPTRDRHHGRRDDPERGRPVRLGAAVRVGWGVVGGDGADAGRQRRIRLRHYADGATGQSADTRDSRHRPRRLDAFNVLDPLPSGLTATIRRRVVVAT